MPTRLVQVCRLGLILRVIDFHETVLGARRLFPNKTARHLKRIRWPEGFRNACPVVLLVIRGLFGPALGCSNVATAATKSV